MVSEQILRHSDLMDSSTCWYVVNYVMWLCDIIMLAIKGNIGELYAWLSEYYVKLVVYRKDYFSNLTNENIKTVLGLSREIYA